jgi:MtN3 and saliva related transmembrane protein
MDTLIINIVGYLASICMIFGYMPQAIATIRTRNTDGIAMPTFIMLGLGSVLFVVQGFMLENWPLVLTNVITTICSVIIFVIKMQNDSKKK